VREPWRVAAGGSGKTRGGRGRRDLTIISSDVGGSKPGELRSSSTKPRGPSSGDLRRRAWFAGRGSRKHTQKKPAATSA